MKQIFLSLLFLLAVYSLEAKSKDTKHWTFLTTWATAVEPTGESDMPRTTNLADCSLREVVHVSLGGERLRLRLSNVFGSEAVEIKSIFISVPLKLGRVKY